MILNKKGAALMQVLLMTVVLAGISAALLRVTLSRTVSARRTQRTVSAQQLIASCMAEVNALWAFKTPKAFQRDLEGGYMYCGQLNGTNCTNPIDSYTCEEEMEGVTYKVTAKMDSTTKEITYTVIQGSDTL